MSLVSYKNKSVILLKFSRTDIHNVAQMCDYLKSSKLCEQACF